MSVFLRHLKECPIISFPTEFLAGEPKRNHRYYDTYKCGIEVPEIVRKLYDFRIFNWILCAFAGDVHGRGRGIRQGCIGGRPANVVENILSFV